MHVSTYTNPYIHIYFTACGPPSPQKKQQQQQHQRVMYGRRNHVFRTSKRSLLH